MPKLKSAVNKAPYSRRTDNRTKKSNRNEVKEQQQIEIEGNDEVTTDVSSPKDSSFKWSWNSYNKPAIELAKSLLGQIFVRILDNGNRVSGRIVETEAYLGTDDKASHSVHHQKTDKNAAMFMKPGTLYVYMTYGMYFCMNISSRGAGSAILIRALEPLEGLDDMRNHRGAKRKDGGTKLKDKELCNGPAKVCQALKLDKVIADQKDLVNSPLFWIEKGESISKEEVVSAPRVGIDRVVEEWRNKPMRFYIRNNSFVSVRNKEAELESQA